MGKADELEFMRINKKNQINIRIRKIIMNIKCRISNKLYFFLEEKYV